MHWVLHVLGIDTQQSRWYDLWSGIATQASVLGAAYGIYRKHNCGRRWCWRLGRYQLTDPDTKVTRVLCWRHHPGIRHKHLTADLIRRIHQKGHTCDR